MFNYGVGGENEEIYPLTPDQLIMRGSILRNTEWIYGLAVYTGSETKMVQNWKNKRQKRSISEHCMNKFLVFYITGIWDQLIFVRESLAIFIVIYRELISEKSSLIQYIYLGNV